MGSQEETMAAADRAVAATATATVELDGALQGWKKKESAKNSRKSPGKKDVYYVAPDGEEIKTKRQMDKYLKAHPGTLTVSDFEWSGPGDAGELALPATENRRRSARLSLKAHTSAEAVDEPKQPVGKRSRKSRENGKDESDVAAAGKSESDTKAATEDVPAEISQDKKGNGEGNAETKAMDVDVPKVDTTETKEMTADAITDETEDEKAVSEGTKVEAAPVSNGHEKPNEEAEIPPPKAIHAIVGAVPKSEGVEDAPAPEEVI